MKIIERLETLRRLNRDPNWVNDNIFRLVSSPQLAVFAYERIKSASGNMTAGEDNVTLDEVSLEALQDICASVRTESMVKFAGKPDAMKVARPVWWELGERPVET